jgi:peptide-methionine (S)-S-oxide reductase
MKLLLPTLLLGLLAMTVSGAPNSAVQGSAKDAPASKAAKEKITCGGGCFWCIEAVFQRLKGVHAVASGYAGGQVTNPSYKQVCSGNTGHAEVVQIEFNPAVISFEKLLEVFWAAHDPTTLNRQGADVGTQYRSVIFFENESQKAAAEKSKAEAQKDFKDPIVTEIVPTATFYKAEDYHQNYYNLNGSRNGYCHMVITPKLQKLLKKGLIEENPPK